MAGNTLRLAVVVNNFGEYYDGIGSYSKVICSNFSSRISPLIYTSKLEVDCASL